MTLQRRSLAQLWGHLITVGLPPGTQLGLAFLGASCGARRTAPPPGEHDAARGGSFRRRCQLLLSVDNKEAEAVPVPEAPREARIQSQN